MNNPPVSYLLMATAVMAAVTFGLRAFPFMVIGPRKDPPAWLVYIGRVTGPAIIAALIVYCLRDVSFSSVHAFLPSSIAVGVCITLHLLWRNPLLSIILSTITYMISLRVFPA